MGIHAYVYRSGKTTAAGTFIPDDCTLNGWSGNFGFDQVCVVNAEGPAEPDKDHPAVMLVAHRTLRGAIHAVSVKHFDEGKWTMFGGNFLATSDSRFWELCEKLGASRFHGAVAIHDRVEG